MPSRKYTKEHYNEVDLLQSGIDHIKAAEILLKQGPEVFDSAGYLAHLGLELMLKAWMLKFMGSFEATHSLEDLIDHMKIKGCRISLTEREIQTFKYLKYFESLRYPAIGIPVEIGSEDIDQIYELAEAIWQQLPDELVKKYAQIPQGQKGRRIFMKRPKEIRRDLELETGISAKK